LLGILYRRLSRYASREGWETALLAGESVTRGDRRRGEQELGPARAAARPPAGPFESVTPPLPNEKSPEIPGRVSYEQREVVLLRLQSGLRFRAIAQLQGVSINTVQGRYRYGLDRLRTLLDGKLDT
jgi:DNA-directed RNA polymerase specialized sigma24 family protein